MKQFYIGVNTSPIQGAITPASSKSESNRALIINALMGFKAELYNLSQARDTQTMQRLLQSKDQVLDVLDAGTTMRFLIAYCGLLGENRILTGTPRMKERPVKILVDALTELGIIIHYKEKVGYPPVQIISFPKQLTNEINIPGDVSSQYISALLMISPMLPLGLNLTIEGKISSRPYIEMTLALMHNFGAETHFIGNKIEVKNKPYSASSFTVESDWSGASYWFSLVALSSIATIKINGLKENSLQGDSKIVSLMKPLGVETAFHDGYIELTTCDSEDEVSFDFSDCPDLGQTVLTCCAAKGIKCNAIGLESLRIKETDRIAALQNEFKKFGAELIEHDIHHWEVIPATYGSIQSPEKVVIDTYDDHRMAMAFAPLATLRDIIINEPDVVNKSYPSFWEDLKVLGFQIDPM